MADYIYLLENRLSGAQQNALHAVREIARAKGLTLFLVGGAVRDMTSGSPVRDLDLAVQGNALKLKKDLEKAGAQIAGEHEAIQALFLRFPGNVRVEISSTLAISYPKPGKPVVKPASILEDLRSRDFTANAMALSLNVGSYGLLMDPLNGVADIENRELRLVSNYGFIEDPIRMVRAARLGARLGWQMEERTLARYETGKAEGYISAMGEFERGYELEEIVHEEDPLRVLGRLESEGWMKVLCASWTPAKANVPELEKLREAQSQLQLQGIQADPSAAHFPLLTAKLAPKDIASLKRSFPRQGFVAEIDALESEAKQFATELGSKQAAAPSGAWKTIFAAPPEVVLWVAYTTRSAALQAKFRSFYTEWPTARQRIPYVLMQEMRIVPELSGYNELVERLFFELMDGHLGTAEEMKAFLEPYSPPAPPPPVNLRRARAAKTARPAKGKKKPTAEAPADGDGAIPLEVALAGGEAADAAAPGADPAPEPSASTVAPISKAPKGQSPKAAPSIEPPATDARPAPAPTANKVEAPPKATAKPPAKAAKSAPAPVKKTLPVKHEASKPVSHKAPAKKSPPAKNVSGRGGALSGNSGNRNSVNSRTTAKVATKAAGHAKTTAKAIPATASSKAASRNSAKTAKTPAKVSHKASAKHAGKTAGKTASRRR